LLARGVAESRHAPRGDWMPARRGRSLAAAVRVVDRVHRGAARLGANALVTVAPRLADVDVLVLHVADRADAGAAVDRDHAHFPRGQAQRGPLALLRHKLDRSAGGAAELAAAAGRELHVVHHGARRDVAQRQAVAHLDVGARTRLHHGAHAQTLRRKDVALLAVGVVQQRDVGGAVRVVLDRGDPGRHAVLLALEVDEAVLALGPAAAVTARYATVRVSPAALLQTGDERLLGLAARDLGAVRPGGEAPAGTRGLVFLDGHYSLNSWPSKSSIVSSGCSSTTAFFHSRVRPNVVPRRLGFDLTLIVRTSSTRTFQICSIAWRIWVLWASSWTRNVYLFAASRA